MSCFGCCFGEESDVKEGAAAQSNSRSTKSQQDKVKKQKQGGGKSYSDDYTTGKVLGEGAFSKVKEAKNNANNQVYAVKIINRPSLSEEDLKGLQQEIAILQEIDHPHIIKLYNVYHEPAKIYLVTELMSGGELFDRIVQKEYYSEQEARDVCRILFAALNYCHDRKVAHRDLKPENLLLYSRDDDNNIKIADFGFAKKCPSSHCCLTQCGTPGYVAPEILSGIPYGTKADMWSIGVILYILLAGYPPFNGNNQRELFRLIKKGRYVFHEQYWGSISDDAKDLVSKLLVVDPKDRLTASEALQTDWMGKTSRSLVTRDLGQSLIQFKKFNAKRKMKQAVLAAIAMKKMSHFVGMGVDQTFGFTQFRSQLIGCDPMDKSFVQ
eukprot:CAMPEP_0203664150 /NCGR_PEP_ID=MMETSP0090-20130426/1616_1 /ASSEMBLY_ACC=CAM_ASM_001088 /TAXON_ID=426623 /ORGANISM="Chaetoceros affinis, Strain CCMP159" /LENGTH=380 /DNA_ID=CAMNT_0050527287 /DNA_START=163 /DNA_END=1305 /DNA_ORIENTATION=+